MCMLSSSVGQLSTCIAVLYGPVMFQVHLAGKQKQDVVRVCGLAKSNATTQFHPSVLLGVQKLTPGS